MRFIMAILFSLASVCHSAEKAFSLTDDEAANQKAQMEIARKIISEDKRKIGMEKFKLGERLEDDANKCFMDKRHDEGVNVCREIVKSLPVSNRAGCAMLYIGQFSDDREALENAVKSYSGCWYGDGVNVGAYSRFLLARMHLKEGNVNKHEEYMNWIKSNNINAINHRGHRLIGK